MSHTLTILQANVGRGGSAHEIALNLGFEYNFDVICLQEPWTSRDTPRRLTKRHPGYEIFSPLEDWTTRPRVLTYIRRRANIRAYQRKLQHTWEESPDIIAVRVNALTVYNVYRPPGEPANGDIISGLDHNTPGPHSVILGDFNTHHEAWDPTSTSRSTGAENLNSWLNHNQLSLITPAGIPTHNEGAVLDLAFSNVEGAIGFIEEHLHSTSDHETISLTVPDSSSHPYPKGRLKYNAINQELFCQTLSKEIEGQEAFPQDVNLMAEQLTKAIQRALEVSTPRTLVGAKGAPWWTTECKEAAQHYRQARRSRGPQCATQEKHQLRKATRAAKRAFWKEQINQADTAAKVHRLARWHKTTGRYRSPPISDGNNIATSPAEKANLLKEVILDRSQAYNTTPDQNPTPQRETIPWTEISTQEVHDALLGASSSTPGIDEIPVKVLRIAWPILQDRITHLYKNCINQGRHPTPWKQAETVMCPKAGRKRKLTTPKAWRPIALLSCLSKGLERLIARRLSRLAIQHKVLASQHFGALPKRGAVDLVTALVHDIEKAWATGQTASLLIMDIQGAFNMVQADRLWSKLIQQGWPTSIANWARSFTTQRQVRVRFEDYTTELHDILGGVPQGSPASPILFMLYTEGIYRLRRPNRKFGFADDIGTLAIGPSLEHNVHQLGEEASELIAWGESNGLGFDLEKCGLQHFTRKRDLHRPSVRIGEIEIAASAQALRYLGIFLDSKLTFREHVHIRAAKARATALHLQRINRTRAGAPAHLLRQAALAAVLASLYYGAEAWFPGHSYKRKDKEISTRIASLVTTCDKVQNIALRGVLPVFCTTPIPALQREGGFAPAAVALDAIRLRFAARLRSLDPLHPLARRLDRTSSTRTTATLTRLQRTSELLDSSPRPLILPISYRDRRQAQLQIGYTRRSKEQEARSFLEWQQSLTPRDIIVFSDGSKQQGLAGAGCLALQGKVRIAQESTPLGPNKEVFDAEVYAALRGLQLASASPGAHLAENIYICLDNLEVALRLLHLDPPETSQDIFLEFRRLAEQWPSRYTLPHIADGSVQIRWCPGHQSIAGNEEADKAAKQASLSPHDPHNPISRSSLSSLRRTARQLARDATREYWGSAAPQRYQDLHIPWLFGIPKELYIQRRLLGPLLASRTGHGDFKQYHERFKHEDASLNCSCGKPKTPEHFFFCTKGRRKSRALLRGPPRLRIPELLGTPKGAAEFAAWAEDTKFFTRICGR